MAKRPWREDEIALLKALGPADHRYAKRLAEQLGRSVAAVRDKLHVLRIKGEAPDTKAPRTPPSLRSLAARRHSSPR